MELKDLSRNWKKLQQTIENEQPGKKRKANSPTPSARHREIKRARHYSVKGGHSPYIERRKTMGLGISNPSVQIPTTEALVTSDATDQNLGKVLTPHTAIDTINAALSPNAHSTGKFIAIDCEMVGVGPRPETTSELARVSIVDFDGVQLYDSFVRPTEPVTDYRTFVSGITPKLLRQARPYEKVREEVAELIADRILVGHDLKHDLDALLLGHSGKNTRDTSKYPPYRAMAGGRPPALRRLAKELLGIEIQSGQHSSIEDARAAMALFRRDKDGFEKEHATKWRPRKASSKHGQAGKGGGRKKKKEKKRGKNDSTATAS